MNVGVSTAWKEILQAVRKSDRAESVSDVYIHSTSANSTLLPWMGKPQNLAHYTCMPILLLYAIIHVLTKFLALAAGFQILVFLRWLEHSYSQGVSPKLIIRQR